MILPPVCVPCRRRMTCAENQVVVYHEAPASWPQVTHYAGDRYRCGGCGHEVVTGFGAGKSAERQPGALEVTS